jgi:hypothetical protein
MPPGATESPAWRDACPSSVPIMRAAYASAFDDDNPLTALAVGEQPEPAPPGPD